APAFEQASERGFVVGNDPEAERQDRRNARGELLDESVLLAESRRVDGGQGLDATQRDPEIPHAQRLDARGRRGLGRLVDDRQEEESAQEPFGGKILSAAQRSSESLR